MESHHIYAEEYLTFIFCSPPTTTWVLSGEKKSPMSWQKVENISAPQTPLKVFHDTYLLLHSQTSHQHVLRLFVLSS